VGRTEAAIISSCWIIWRPVVGRGQPNAIANWPPETPATGPGHALRVGLKAIDQPLGLALVGPARYRSCSVTTLSRPHPHAVRQAITACATTTLVVTAGSYWLPADWSATAVGLCFLAATYALVVRNASNARVCHFGLSFGGLLETDPVEWTRLLRETITAIAWALGTALVVFPPFVLGFLLWWQPRQGFHLAPLSSISNDALGQLLVVALPEEAFYRGYLQTSLDDAWKMRWKLFGGTLSPGLLLSSALFALGHLLTEPNPTRLAVFFPSLLFGWLRTRTRGTGAGIGFHALSNLFSAYLGRCFAMWS